MDNKRIYVVLAFGLFLISFSSAALTNVTLLNESFDSGDLSNWTTDWDLSTTQFVSSPNSIEVSAEDTTLTSINLDTSDATEFYVSFRYYIDGIDANDDLSLYYYDGTTYDLIDEIGDDAEGTWLTYSATVTDAQYFIDSFRIYVDGTSVDNNEFLWIDDVEIWKQYDSNNLPVLSNITASHSTIKGGSTITIYANTTSNGVNDTDLETLYLYCDDSVTPTAANTECTSGVTTDSSYPYALTCSFVVPLDDTTHVEYCRIYDGSGYSNVSNVSYTTDSTAPTTTITSVANDSVASYFDTVNDGKTDVLVLGEANMVCRWGGLDLVYDSMTNDCVVSGTTANCSVDDVISQGYVTRYVSCEDSFGNAQTISTNLDVSFYLDYTAPTTSDNSNSNIQAPPYSVTITEQDNVDSDVLTYYCVDTSNSCSPTTLIDNGGLVTFTSSNRGVNYLRYYSVDDALNSQSVVSKTININRLPVFTSAVDNATTIKGGESVTVSTVSSEPDSQQLTLYVCDSANATFEGCGGSEYCSATGSANVSCVFVSEGDSATHTWYAYLFDDSDEAALTNPFSGSYVTDLIAPSITLNSPLNDSTITQTSVTVAISVNEILSSAWFSFEGGVNFTMTNTSLYAYSYVNDSIPNADYNLTIWANDSYGNLATLTGYSFTIDDTAGDTTAPTITVVSPTNFSYDLDGSVLLNITSDENLSWAGYVDNGGSLVSLGNVSMKNWNSTASFSEGEHNLTFYANDTSSNLNQGNSSVTFYVDLNNPSVANFSCDDVNDSEDVVCFIEASDSVGLDYVLVSYNATGSYVNSSVIDLNGVSNSTNYTIFSGNHMPGNFDVLLYVYDLSGRFNDSLNDTVLVSDDTLPVINNVTYSPNSTDDLDPDVRVYVNATVTEDYNISSVVLQYRNSSASSWSEVTMSNNSVESANASVVYNGSFLPSEETWTFRINATDSTGNSNVSVNYTIVVENDTSQNVSTTIPSVKSFTYVRREENNSLGNLILNNTGDGVLNFNVRVSSDSLGSRLGVNYTGNSSANYSVSSGNFVNITIDINTTGLTSGLYDYNVSVVSEVGTEVFSRQLNIQSSDSAYLDVSIESYSASVTKGQTGVVLIARVTNLGTADAEDVYLNWTLPSGFSITSGSVSRYFSTIPIGSSGTNSITISVSSLMNDANVSIYANASSGNAEDDSDNKTVTVGEPTVVLVETPGTTSGGGSSGGGGGGIVYSKVIEVVGGEEVSFEIEVDNPRINLSLENLILELEGFLSQYVTVSPAMINRISSGGSESFFVTLEIPSYKENYEEYSLKATIKGYVVGGSRYSRESYKEIQNIKLIVQEVSKTETDSILVEAEDAIEEMRLSGFNVEEVLNLFDEAKIKLTEGKNGEVFDLSKRIVEIRDRAFEVEEIISSLISSLEDPRSSSLIGDNGALESNLSFEGLITGNVAFASNSIVDLVNLAIVAFERGDYELAHERAIEARSLLILERRGNLGFFLYLYGHFVILGVFILGIGSFFGYKKYRKSSIANKIEDMNLEEKNLRVMFADSQGKYFAGKLSSENYKREIEYNRKRLANLRKSRVTLRNKRIKILQPEQILQELKNEISQVETEIKSIQTAYYVDRKISGDEYRIQFEILNGRLAEIEGERATIELIDKKKLNPTMKEIDKNLEKEISNAKSRIQNDGQIKIIFMRVIGFFKNPLKFVRQSLDEKKKREESKIKETIKSMGVL